MQTEVRVKQQVTGVVITFTPEEFGKVLELYQMSSGLTTDSERILSKLEELRPLIREAVLELRRITQK